MSFSLTCPDAVFIVHFKNNIQSIAWLEKKAKLLQERMKKFLYVFRFGFFINTFLAYAMKSIIALEMIWWRDDLLVANALERFLSYF